MKKIALIRAQWHADIVDNAVESFKKHMLAKGYKAQQMEVFTVPGSLEIPLKGKQLMRDGFDAIIGFGFVVDGGIYRHEFVAQAVISGLMSVQLEMMKPFFSVILTPQKFNEHDSEHVQYFKEHMLVKGEEAANAVHAILGDQ